MYTDFSRVAMKSIPTRALGAVAFGNDSATTPSNDGWKYCRDGTNRVSIACADGTIVQDMCYDEDPCYEYGGLAQSGYTPDGGICGGNSRPPRDPCNPNSTCYYQDVCSPLMDGTGICTPNSKVPADYEDQMANRDCSIKNNAGTEGSPCGWGYSPDNMGYTECAQGYTCESDPNVSEGGYCVKSVSNDDYTPDESTPSNDDLAQSGYTTDTSYTDGLASISNDFSSNSCEGVRCISLYKPCPEGYMDADPCCPHTGNCIPDPDYVATDIPVLPVGDTPSTQLDASVPTRGTSPNTGIVPPKHLGGASGLVGGIGDTRTYRSDTSSSEFNYFDQQSDLLSTDTTDTADTTETPTEEKPKESGLGILAIGLIALKVLAT